MHIINRHVVLLMPRDILGADYERRDCACVRECVCVCVLEGAGFVCGLMLKKCELSYQNYIL